MLSDSDNWSRVESAKNKPYEKKNGKFLKSDNARDNLDYLWTTQTPSGKLFGLYVAYMVNLASVAV